MVVRPSGRRNGFRILSWTMLRRRTWLLVLLVLALRVVTQGWDSGLLTPHPDERQVAYVAERGTGWFSDPGFYAYGSLHFHLVRAVTALEGRPLRYAGLLRGGRTLSLAACLFSILLGFWLARRAWGERTAALALLLAAFVPLDLQQSHYATVEAHHAFWVMAALAALWWLARSAVWPAALLAGAAAGASLAVKVSSLGLAVPVALALLLAAQRRGPLRAAALGSAALATAVGAFWLGQPWAFRGGHMPLAALAGFAAAAALLALAERTGTWTRIGLTLAAPLVAAVGLLVHGNPAMLLNPSWLYGVGEQVAMVAGRADLPYVRVYRHTLPFLYSLRELGLWGLGPVLLLAALGGACWGTVIVFRRWRRWIEGHANDGMVLLAILLAWAVPMALRLATLRVKYLRYWEPLVVPAVLLAAWGLSRLRWRGRAVRAAAVLLTVVWGLSYLAAFTEAHPHRTAARWLNSVLQPGQTVAFEHWDETLDIKPGISRVELPSYELPDDAGKVEAWCRNLAKADWVVMTSNRVRRTVLANPERFPRTARLYRLLLSGEAGFEPLTTARRGPHLLGLRFPVQMADESFVNYDFPRVVILKRVETVDAEALARRVGRPLPFLEAMGPGAVERRFVDPLPAMEPRPGAAAQLVAVLLWLLIFGGAGAAAWVLLLPLLRSWPDAGAGLALTTAWMALAWLLWIGSEVGIWPASAVAATVLWLLLLGAGAWRALVIRRTLAVVWRARWRRILAVLGVTAAVGILFLVVRAFNPAIYWGEKPMDLSFLKAFLRATAWPPGEPWMAGMPLHYYYFGEVLAATPMKIAGACAAVGYNLMAATVPALATAVLASFGLAMAARRRAAAAVLLPLLIVLTGNLAWPWLIPMLRAHRYFDLWWATSRVIPGFAIDEYPLWTALFADLHAHFLALPVLLTALAWGYWTVHLGRARRWVPASVLTGMAVAVLAATNPWDVLVLTAALGVGALTASGRPWKGQLRLALAALVSVAAAAPFLVELVAWLAAGVGGRGLFLTQQDFAPAWAVLRHFGVFLLPLIAAAVLSGGWWLLGALPLAGAGVVAGLGFHSSAAALGLALAPLFAAAWAGTRDRGLRLAFSMAGLGMLVVAAAERFTLIDRMNTLFKTYNGVWILLAVALALILLRGAGWPRRLALLLWIPLEIVGLANIPLGIYQGWTQPKAVSPRPTLDGEAYLGKDDPQTAFAASILNAAARPGDVIAEAAGPAYQEYTRMAMHTGCATVVGWEWHLQQRGQDQREIAARRHDLQILYGGSDPARRRAVLDRYRVRWIVLGDLERRAYLLGRGHVFSRIPGVVEIGRRNGMAVYEVLPATAAAGSEERTPLPPGLRKLSILPVETAPRLRALSRNAAGGVAVLGGGSVVRLDDRGLPVRAAPPPPCTTVGAVLWKGRMVAGCAEGPVLQLGDGWEEISRPGRLAGLTSAKDLWAWGPGGVWRSLSGKAWRRFAPGPVTAVAAARGRVAWATPTGVWRATDGRRTKLPPPGGTVRSLAWEGPDLWALTATGLQLSGGAVLPWRPAFPSLRVEAMAGEGGILWLGLDDGRLVSHQRPPCASPWHGERGSQRGRLAEPRGVAVSPDGWFVVADTQNHRLQYFTLSGACLDARGEKGSAPGQFREPSGLALAPDGTLAVADTWNGRVQLLEPDGSVRTVGRNLFGPRGVAWAGDGSLLVADTGNRRLLRATPPGWKLQTLATLDGPVVGLTVLGGTVAAAVPQKGIVALIDLKSGATVRTLEVPGWRDGTQQEGYLLELDPGRLLASAPRPGELWLLDPQGRRKPTRIASDLPSLTAMALLPDARVLASETFENRLVRIPVEMKTGE